MKESFYNNRTFEYEQVLRRKYTGILIGTAIGDTLGMPIEGWKPEQIRKYVGEIREPINPIVIKNLDGTIKYQDESGPLLSLSADRQKGQWTDDTLLTLATARSVVKSRGLDLHSLVEESLKVYQERNAQLNTATTGFSGFGHTTSQAFENLLNGIPPQSSGIMSGKSAGNGPAIKMAPVGMYMHATGKYDEGLTFARLAGRMTHLDERSIASGIVQAHAVYSLLKGIDREAFIKSLVDVCQQTERSVSQGKRVTLASRLAWVLENQNSDENFIHHHISPDWPVTKNYPFTIFMFQRYWDNPIGGILKLVNCGGDCDSTAAMFGALAGARFGNIFPREWTELLDGKNEFQALGDAIYNLH